MKTGASMRNRQGGAVAVIVGIGIVLLVGFLAMVIDLGHLYIAKTELQNAADAAALAGAKQLDGKTRAQCCDPSNPNSAVSKAIATAAQNNYDFSNQVNITSDNISLGSLPDGPWVLASTATDADAVGKFFLKVDTGSRQLSTWVAQIFSLVTGGSYLTTSTFGMAVAGRTKVQITPLAICALQIGDCPPPVGSSTTTGNCGFIPGMAYNVRTINPLGPGTPYWIDPVATNATECDGSTSNTLPFVCTGEITVPVAIGGTVYTNPGLSNPQVEALNSRFDVYGNQAKCDPVTAPPDPNRREYLADDNTLFRPDSSPLPPPYTQITCTDVITGCNWQIPGPFGTVAHGPVPAQQAAQNCTAINLGDTKCDYTNTVVWANNRPPTTPANFFDSTYVPPQHSASGWPPPNIKPPTTPPALTYQQVYPLSGTPSAASGNSRYYTPVTDNTPLAGRRNMNLAIIQCTSSGGSCRLANVVGVGSFFMTTQAGRKVGNDSQPTIYLEYNRMLTQGEISGTDIRLFR